MGLRLLRTLPFLALLAIFTLTLGSSARDARLKPPAQPETNYPYYGACNVPLLSSPATVPYPLTLDHGVIQPLATTTNVATCSLAIDPYNYNTTRAKAVYWDPVALAPDPTTVALRTVTSWATYFTNNTLTYSWYPPLVVTSVPGVADPPRTTLAIDFRLFDYATGLNLKVDPDASPALPAAFQYVGGSPPTSMAGNHPVLGHGVCGGTSDIQALRVVQSVVRADVELGVNLWTLAQKIRLPVATRLEWLEFAIGYVVDSANWPYDNAEIRIYDAEGQAAPPAVWGTPLASTWMSGYPYIVEPAGGTWISPYDFPVKPVLEANHDYWLFIDSHKDHSFFGRFLNGDEPPQFQERIGPLYVQGTSGAPWQRLDRRALSFSVIGTPTGTVGVSPPAPSRATFALRVTPNPSRGFARASWSGAAGAAWFEVLDARGRRVATGEGSSAGQGQWEWRGTDEAGRAVPAGVYFLRATDDAGRSATERVVLVR